MRSRKRPPDLNAEISAQLGSRSVCKRCFEIKYCTTSTIVFHRVFYLVLLHAFEFDLFLHGMLV